jgi:alanine racemase
VELRKNNITLPIMVMNPSEESFDTLITYSLEPEIYSFKIFHALIHALSGKGCSIHLKLDTGMRRLGFEQEDIDGIIELLRKHPHIRVASIFSHLAGADEAINDPFSREQAAKFTEMAERIMRTISYKPICHILNSPGILRLPDLQMDMVRLGIGLYGIDPTSSGYPLKPVASLKTIVSQVKEIQAGETVGYGRKGKASKKMKLATIAIGYADGFSRAFSHGKGEVLIHGKRAPVVGIVCMDMTMVDVTDMSVHEGDEVIVFGEGLSIDEVASKINTISYEILTNTSERVKRVFVAESI